MINIETNKILIWDSQKNAMVVKTEVYAQIVTNKGSILFEEGPLYCETGQDIFYAAQQLKEKLIKTNCLNFDS